MVVESWESVQGNQSFLLLHEVLFCALADSMHKNGYHGVHGYLRIMGLERAENRKVALSSGLCLES